MLYFIHCLLLSNYYNQASALFQNIEIFSYTLKVLDLMRKPVVGWMYICFVRRVDVIFELISLYSQKEASNVFY